MLIGESISTDIIRTCMKMLEKQNYIEIINTDGVRMVSLTKRYDCEERVREIINRIESVVTL